MSGPVTAGRWSIASRVAAAIFGGYALAAFSSASLSLAVPMDKRDAVQLGVMVGFLLYAGGIVWAFSTKRARGAWLGLSVATLPFLILFGVLRGGAA
ncbi:DUF3649 domain-containing protein [Myxococcus sp. AM001]|uniref:DUF3649 domain-containing protein n=1 Tax=Myxococcus vastator TaxID=2709664 RepID=UPI0013D0FF75|nr:DUF3649 domain-containing protein [Myxococcus vastator]NVJ09796.1 DUF3649 domain-containing protein [Myxococcus sp. AM001]